MEAVRNYLEKMGSTFLVAALIPSLAFVSVALLAFSPIPPQPLLDILSGNESIFGPTWLILFFFSVVLGFVLASLNTFIHKIFEGYVFLRHFPFLLRAQKNKAQRLQKQIRRIERIINRRYKTLRKREPSIAFSSLLQKLESRKFDLLVQLEVDFPRSNDSILPTQYGNALRAAELYSVERYNLDALTIWPRLVYVIPEKYMSYVDHSNNQLSFLLNFSVLSILFSCLCFLASGYQYLSSILVIQGWEQILSTLPLNKSYWIYQERSVLYFAGGVFTLGIAYIFNRASLLVVKEYGNLIRGSIDLFRSQLLVALNLKLPVDSIEEQQIWEKISDFFLFGNQGGDNEYFEYQYRTNVE